MATLPVAQTRRACQCEDRTGILQCWKLRVRDAFELSSREIGL